MLITHGFITEEKREAERLLAGEDFGDGRMAITLESTDPALGGDVQQVPTVPACQQLPVGDARKARTCRKVSWLFILVFAYSETLESSDFLYY